MNKEEKELEDIIEKSKININKSLDPSTLLFLKHLSEIFESGDF